MKALEESMKNSLKICIRNAMISYDNEERKDWIVKNCCQVTLGVDSVYWTRMAEEIYLVGDSIVEEEDQGKMDEFYIRISLDLDDAITLIKTNIPEV